jgi:excisionase family DNA binding protein
MAVLSDAIPKGGRSPQGNPIHDSTAFLRFYPFGVEGPMEQKAPAPVMTPNECAHESGTKPGFIYDELRAGRLPHYRLGSSGWIIRIARKDFEEWLAARRVEAPREVERPRNKPVREVRPA